MGRPIPKCDEPCFAFVSRRGCLCARCGASVDRHDTVVVVEGVVCCVRCGRLGELVFLPSGDALLTRRSRKASSRSAPMFERRRRRWTRIGAFVEEQALEAAVRSCGGRAPPVAKPEVRNAASRAKLAVAIRETFVCIPPQEVEAIVAFVFRRRGPRDLTPTLVERTVTNHVRHRRTDYDEILKKTGNWELARAMVRPSVESIVRAWRGQLLPHAERAPARRAISAARSPAR